MNGDNELEQFVKDWKDLLTNVLEKTKEQEKANNHPMMIARTSAKTELLYMLIAFLNKKETDMQELKSKLIKQVISLEALEPIKKHSELEEKIQEGVAALSEMMDDDKNLQKTGASIPARAIKEDIEWGHFSAKISQMRADNKVGSDITTAKRGENFYLVKLPKGETVKPRKRKD